VIRGPLWDEDIDAWSRLVNSKDPRITIPDVSLGTLGKLPIDRVVSLGSKRQMVSAAITYLASTIRNRDAHRYAPDVRAAHFKAVPRVFIPAFNVLLGTLDQHELRDRLNKETTVEE
jgi:hypothetical protein